MTYIMSDTLEGKKGMVNERDSPVQSLVVNTIMGGIEGLIDSWHGNLVSVKDASLAQSV